MTGVVVVRLLHIPVLWYLGVNISNPSLEGLIAHTTSNSAEMFN